MSDLLITNVDVLTNEGVLKNHAIEIENGFITSIVKDSEVEKAKESAKDVLDGKGLVPAVCKMAFGNKLGVKIEHNVDPRDFFAAAWGDIVC
mgnify:CR=1 FL=1